MMRGIWFTFLPLLAAAALTLWGGERLARREVETRIPADRERLHDFAGALRDELDRLDDVYRGHLARIARDAPYAGEAKVSAACAELVGTRECRVFRQTSMEMEAVGTRPPQGAARLPEVVAEGGKRPLNLALAVVLPKSLLEKATAGDEGVIAAPGGHYEVRWLRPDHDHLVAFTVDVADMQQHLEKHLAAWLVAPFAPLAEAKEQVAVLGPRGGVLVPPPAEGEAGPAALLMPHRTGLGEWQVQAWDRRSVALTRDPATLAVAAAIACSLVLLGAFLFAQQRRALRLAEERVSFVNRVSHELGTPLTNILLNLDLAGRALGERPAESRRRLALVHEEVQRLGRLVANVLTFSRGERKMLELHPADCVPDEVVGGVLAQFQPSLERRGVTVEWQRGAGEITRLDPDALAQIAGNLISNVEKYASVGAWLGIETAMEKGRLRLRISDRGPGIPPPQRERIFEAFERVHRGVSEGASGTGLGLSIARDLARRMQGELSLVPAERGACFELDLPLSPRLILLDNESAA